MTNESIPVVACNTDAHTPDQQRRLGELSAGLRRRGATIEELDDGYAFHYDADAEFFVMLAEWATLERICCSFLDFSLEWAHDSETARIVVSGGEGVKAFVEQFGRASGAASASNCCRCSSEVESAGG